MEDLIPQRLESAPAVPRNWANAGNCLLIVFRVSACFPRGNPFREMPVFCGLAETVVGIEPPWAGPIGTLAGVSRLVLEGWRVVGRGSRGLRQWASRSAGLLAG